jgi:hypothetical protein
MAYANAIGLDALKMNNMSRLGPKGPNIYHK